MRKPKVPEVAKSLDNFNLHVTTVLLYIQSLRDEIIDNLAKDKERWDRFPKGSDNFVSYVHTDNAWYRVYIKERTRIFISIVDEDMALTKEDYIHPEDIADILQYVGVIPKEE